MEEINSMKLLAVNVIKQAFTDYEKCRSKYKSASRAIKDIVRFFASKDCDFWCDVIGCDSINIREKFFDINGGEAKVRSIAEWEKAVEKVDAQLQKEEKEIKTTQRLIELYEEAVITMQKKIVKMKEEVAKNESGCEETKSQG